VTLGSRLRARIRSHGPIPFPEWMQTCLYDSVGGFYAKGRHPAGVGQGTHFATSPTLHPFFAHCIARELAAAWKDAGKPAAWEVVEFGAGTGALARDAMWELRRLNVPARWTAIDVRPGPPMKDVRWMAEPPPAFDAAVANEFLDALPFDVVEWNSGDRGAGAWHTVGVGLDGDRFAWRLLGPAPASLGLPAPLSPTPVATDAAEDSARPEHPERRILMPANEPWLDRLRGAGVCVALIVDYGQAGPAREVRAFRGHDFADPLSEPGTVDLTADVDFAALGAHASQRGFSMELETQEAFLIRHGVFEAINRIDRTTRKGTSDYLRLRQLMLPTGFGAAFKVARLVASPPATP
jgi:NADH dehydrogenase [ubiquinone] 1 alpha subcomplex assembly factor 7